MYIGQKSSHDVNINTMCIRGWNLSFFNTGIGSRICLVSMLALIFYLLMAASFLGRFAPPSAGLLKSHGRGLLQESKPLRILYTITTLTEYDTGSRSTTKGHDRMQNTLIPVMRETVTSLLAEGYEVDVFIVAHFVMTREHLIREALPPQVGLRYWDDAAPLTYDPGNRENPEGKLRNNTLGLARQHRFVVRQHLMEYDFFMCFEDDMIVKAPSVANHLDLTRKLYAMRAQAPETSDRMASQKPIGRLNKRQIQRLIPGLMRVEVLLDEEKFGAQNHPDPVPVALHDPLDIHCCHLMEETISSNRPSSPSSDRIFLWETGIRALGVRNLPGIGYVAFQRGPTVRQGEETSFIADYWAGEDGYFGKDRRPTGGDFAYINNQGGWMATREQIWEWNTEICQGGFLPPYESPHFNHDGLDPRNVEWWSGGMGMFTSRHGCNMQRIVSLEHNSFPKHLIYHSANNKQRQLSGKRDRFVKVDTLYGQLLTVKSNLEKAYALVS